MSARGIARGLRVDRAEQVWKSVRGNRRVSGCDEGPLLEARALLRRGEVGPAERVLQAAGKLVLIHRPDALESILASLAGRFGAAEIIPIFPRPDAAAIRVIVRAVKGRRTPPSLRPGLVLNDADGRPTAVAEAILRDAAALDIA